MFAIVKTGGKQYKVAEGDVITIEKLEGEAGSTYAFDQVLMTNNNGKMSVGAPFLNGVKVNAEILGHERSRKIIVFKKKRRQNYRRKNTHRQDYTVVRITGIA